VSLLPQPSLLFQLADLVAVDETLAVIALGGSSSELAVVDNERRAAAVNSDGLSEGGRGEEGIAAGKAEGGGVGRKEFGGFEAGWETSVLKEDMIALSCCLVLLEHSADGNNIALAHRSKASTRSSVVVLDDGSLEDDLRVLAELDASTLGNSNIGFNAGLDHGEVATVAAGDSSTLDGVVSRDDRVLEKNIASEDGESSTFTTELGVVADDHIGENDIRLGGHDSSSISRMGSAVLNDDVSDFDAELLGDDNCSERPVVAIKSRLFSQESNQSEILVDVDRVL